MTLTSTANDVKRFLLLNKQCDNSAVDALIDLYWVLRARRDNGFALADEELDALKRVEDSLP